MSTFVISVGIDPNDLDVQETTDNFGAFPTREAAAKRLVEMIDGRMDTLRRSKIRARRLIRSAAKSNPTLSSN